MKAREAVVEKTVEGHVVWFAGAVASLRGFPIDEEGYLKYFRVVHPVDLARANKLLAELKNAEVRLRQALSDMYVFGERLRISDIEEEYEIDRVFKDSPALPASPVPPQ